MQRRLSNFNLYAGAARLLLLPRLKFFQPHVEKYRPRLEKALLNTLAALHMRSLTNIPCNLSKRNPAYSSSESTLPGQATHVCRLVLIYAVFCALRKVLKRGGLNDQILPSRNKYASYHTLP